MNKPRSITTMLSFAFPCWLLGALLLAGPTMATTYYVNNGTAITPAGSDANNGTSVATPWLTVRKACSILVAGDTVLIRSGTYDETSVETGASPCGTIQAGIVPTNDGDSATGQYITFKGYPGDVRPIMLGKDARDGVLRSALLFSNGQHHIIYDSIHFHKGETGIMIRSSNPGHHLIFRNLIVDSTYMGCDDNNGGVSMYTSGYNSGDPITGPSQRNILVENCELFSNGSYYRGAYFVFNSSGIHSYSCDSCIFRNNNIHDQYVGMNFKYATRFTETYGNTIHDCYLGYNGTAHAGGTLSYQGPDQVGSSFHHNILYRNNVGATLTWFGSGGTRYPDSLHYFYNNTIDCGGPYPAGGEYLTGVGIYQRYGHFNRAYYFNNIIYNPITAASIGPEETRAAMAHGNGNQTPGWVYDDYNMFYSSTSVTDFYSWSGTSYTLAEWRAATPNATMTGSADTGNYSSGTVGTQGDHSIVANPLFTNAATHDYTLQVGSPALSGGKGGSFTFFPGFPIQSTVTLDTYFGALGTSTPDSSVRLGDAPAITEGVDLVFPITIGSALASPCVITFSTANGAAVAPGDYAPVVGGQTSIAAGSTTGSIVIATVDDTLLEQSETMTLTLTNATIGTIVRATAEGTIMDNDTISRSWIIPSGLEEYPITTSGTYSGYTDSAIGDNVINPRGGEATTWASDDNAGVPHWINVDFEGNAPREVIGITIHWAWNSVRSSWMTSVQYQIQGWSGEDLFTLATVNSASADSSTSTMFPPFVADSIRIYQPAGQGPIDYSSIMWLTELQIWGPLDTIPSSTVNDMR